MYIRVKTETARALNLIRGILMRQEGAFRSYDDVINFLLLNCRVDSSLYPDWPIFSRKASKSPSRGALCTQAPRE